jgi:ribosome-associated protein
MPPNPTADTLARRMAAHAIDFKADDVVLLDLKGLTEMTDWFLIASGTSDTHVRSIAARIQEAMAANGVRPARVEGETSGRWVVLDYVDVVVHVFHPTLRAFYQLERLWGDAPAHAVTA